MSRCFRCLHIRPAYVHINGVPMCREHAREANAQPIDIVIAPVMSGRSRLEVRP